MIEKLEEIKARFEELGLKDWAYEGNPQNPTWVESRFGQDEGFANLVWEE